MKPEATADSVPAVRGGAVGAFLSFGICNPVWHDVNKSNERHAGRISALQSGSAESDNTIFRSIGRGFGGAKLPTL